MTVTEGINIKFNLLGFVIPTERFKSFILTFLYNPTLRAVVKNAYRKDMICAKIIVQPDAYPRFGIREGLVWMKNQLKRDVICILWDTFQRGRRLIEIIIDHAHQTIGHYGQWKTSN